MSPSFAKIIRSAGVRASDLYIGNNNLSRESPGKSANNIVRPAEHASRMRINLSSGPRYLRTINGITRGCNDAKAIWIHARAPVRPFFSLACLSLSLSSRFLPSSSFSSYHSLPLSLSLSADNLARKWFSCGNKQANPGKKAPQPHVRDIPVALYWHIATVLYAIPSCSQQRGSTAMTTPTPLFP